MCFSLIEQFFIFIFHRPHFISIFYFYFHLDKLKPYNRWWAPIKQCNNNKRKRIHFKGVHSKLWLKEIYILSANQLYFLFLLFTTHAQRENIRRNGRKVSRHFQIDFRQKRMQFIKFYQRNCLFAYGKCCFMYCSLLKENSIAKIRFLFSNWIWKFVDVKIWK